MCCTPFLWLLLQNVKNKKKSFCTRISWFLSYFSDTHHHRHIIPFFSWRFSFYSNHNGRLELPLLTRLRSYIKKYIKEKKKLCGVRSSYICMRACVYVHYNPCNNKMLKGKPCVFSHFTWLLGRVHKLCLLYTSMWRVKLTNNINNSSIIRKI